MKKCHIRLTVLLMLLSIGTTVMAAADSHRKYDEQHPVIIVGDWDKPPYEFQNDQGIPTGSNIDVMRAVLDQLDIPCQFMLKEWGNAIKAFERGEADLILANARRYRKPPFHVSRNIINYNRIRALTLGDTVPPLSMRQLIEGGVVLKPSDYSLYYFLQENPDYINHIEFQSPKVAFLGIRDKDYKYFVWGEEPLKWKTREFNMEQDGFILNEVDIPVSEIHIIGRDKELIDEIDDAYSRLKQSGEVENINRRWFSDGDTEGMTHVPLSVYIILAILVLTALAYFVSRLARSHAKRASRHSSELNEMMYKALQMGSFYVMQYDIARNKLSNRYGSFLPAGGMTMEEFSSRIHLKEQKEFRNKIELMTQGRERRTAINKRWNAGTPEEPRWLNLIGHSMVELDDNGRPAYIINTVNDVTKDVEEVREAHDLSHKYVRLSNMPMVAMSFYDKEGNLLDINETMRQLCHFDLVENERYYWQVNMYDIPAFRDLFPPGSKEERSSCQRLERPHGEDDSFIEFEVRPLQNTKGEVVNYIVSAIDVTEEHDSDQDMHRKNREMQAAVNQINQLELQLQYILEKTNMYVWQLDFSKRTIAYTQVLRQPEYTVSFEEYYDYMYDDKRETAVKTLEHPETWKEQFSLERHFKRSLLAGLEGDRWYSISGISITDENGNATGMFGIIRDITDQRNAEQKLRQETLRAESSGLQKSMFLASMTHELRTPLNSIVGFSDLLRTTDNPEERKEFIRIIRTHCDILLRLITDILEASTLSDTQIQIVPKQTDFAQEFDNICQALCRRVENPNVTFVKQAPCTRLVTTIDMDRIKQVVTNFVTNSVKHTRQGHIKIGYCLQKRKVKGEGSPDGSRNGIYLYCEDTGTGIPKEKQHTIFERFVKLNEFVQGTGLGLTICKNIIERCNGEIGVDSEEGKGSTFWFWIPCEIEDYIIEEEKN